MALWTYLFADLVTNQIISELPVSGVRMTKVINGSGQFQGTVKLGDARVQGQNVYDLTRPVRRVIYALRDGQPWWGGIIWASDYDSSTQTVQLGAADFWSYFDHRKVLDTLPAPPIGGFYVAGLSRIYTSQEQNDIARDLVAKAQAATAGNIGIVADTADSGIMRARTYNGFEMVDVGQALRDLAGFSDGCDLAFDVGQLDINGRPTRILRIGTPALTQQGDDHAWDLNGNLLSYKWSSGGGVMSTRVFATGAGQDTGTLIAVSEDTSVYSMGWPLLEDDEAFSETADLPTLQQEADSDRDSLHLPVLSITMTVNPAIAPTLAEIAVGDTGNLVIPAGDLFIAQGITLPVRLTSISVAIDDTDAEVADLTCFSDLEVI